MILFLCGKGKATEAILHELVAQRHQVALFSHEGEPIVEMARRYGIPVSTGSVNDLDQWPFRPAAIASIGYLTIIKPHVLAAVRGRVFNCHYALLPNHRGRSSVPWAILDGDQYSGITYHWIDSGVDTGNVLLQAVCQIEAAETQASLFEKLHRLAIAYWPAALKLAFQDWPGVEQMGEVKVHRVGPPNSGQIDPDWPWNYVERYVRAMTFPPKPYATYGGREVRSMDDYEALRRGELSIEWKV